MIISLFNQQVSEKHKFSNIFLLKKDLLDWQKLFDVEWSGHSKGVVPRTYLLVVPMLRSPSSPPADEKLEKSDQPNNMVVLHDRLSHAGGYIVESRPEILVFSQGWWMLNVATKYSEEIWTTTTKESIDNWVFEFVPIVSIICLTSQLKTVSTLRLSQPFHGQ
jgi:hypothetical protein